MMRELPGIFGDYVFLQVCSKDSSRFQLLAASVVSFCFEPLSRVTSVRNFYCDIGTQD